MRPFSTAQFAAILLVVIVLLSNISGCKYDVAEPMWEKPYSPACPDPEITNVTPSSAPAGVNYITITGNNLAPALDSMKIRLSNGRDTIIVYNGILFNTTPAEVRNISPTSITVYRPNLVLDSCIIKILPQCALLKATYTYGKIDVVCQDFGGFNDKLGLYFVTIDSSGTVYVGEFVTSSIWRLERINPDGVKTPISLSMASGQGLQRTPTDARLRQSDGYLYVFNSSDRWFHRIDLSTGLIYRYLQMPSGKIMRYGDFDANGYLYGGGVGTDLCIVPPSLSPITYAQAYQTDSILAVRVFNNYVYIAARQRGTLSPVKIFRHQITSPGSLGQKELVVDFATTGFSDRTVRDISFSQSGKMFITTGNTDPILLYDQSTGTIDYFYKNIIPPYGVHSAWGNTNYLYMISAENWTLVRVDMGENGTPYY